MASAKCGCVWDCGVLFPCADHKDLITLKFLQERLPWHNTYSEEFQASPLKHKNFQHAFHHVEKAAGRLSAIIEEGDHEGAPYYPAEGVRKYLADLIICAVRMANTAPNGAVDLQEAVLDRIEEKMGQRLAARSGEESKMTHEERFRDIKEHPEKHRHTFDKLQSCCFVNGALSAKLMDAHEGLAGPTRRCDVTAGACACGATH